MPITKVKTKNHEEWLQLRSRYIGGSDAAAVVGMNPFSSSYALWAEKTGKKPGFSGNLATEVGTYLEEFVAQKFAAVTGKKVRKCNHSFLNSDYPFAIANIDREIVGEDAGLEIKTTNSLNLKKFKNGEYPANYYCQCVHYMAVTGKKRWYLAVLIGNNEFKWFVIERDEAEIAALMGEEAAFWDEIRQKCTEGSQARFNADKKYFDAKKSLNDELLKAEQKLQADIEAEYQKIEDRTRELMNLTSYDEALSFEDLEKNLTRETKKIEQWGAAIDVLEQKIGGSQLLKDILSSGMGGALNKAYELAFNVSDDELERYTRLYDEKFSKANLQATKELAGEVSEGITKAQTEFYTTCQTLGVDISEEFNGKMNGMITSITDALSGIKTAFETFEPKMKLPHFKVEGKFDLENGTVPTAAVEWYSKAMQSPMLLNKPTIFGYNPSTGNYMGGGEAGAEIVGGASSLMNMMKNAVAEQNSALVVVLSKILDAILMLDANMGGHLRDALEGVGLDVNHREFARLVKAVN